MQNILFGTKRCWWTIVLALMAIPMVVVHGQSKTCKLKEFDLCMTNFYYDQKGIPTNERQLKKSCATMKTLHKCLTAYFNRCLSRQIREALQLWLDSTTKRTFDICSKPAGHPDRLEIFQHGPCLNSNSKQIGTCTEMMKDVVFFTLENSYRDRIPVVCCNVRRMLQCSARKTADLCGQDTSEFARINNPFGALIDGVCLFYDPNTSICQDKMVPEGYKTKEDPKSALSRMVNAFF